MSPVDSGPHASLERMNRFQEVEARQIIRDLDLPAGSQGLDVGCGVGLWALWLAEAVGPGGRVVGIEPEAEKVEAARALVGGKTEPGRLEFTPGDGTAIPLPDRSVDWVWCGDVLHHVVETERALREFLRVVRPGGRVIVKESQVLSAMFLPGHPELERRIQLAEIRRTLGEGAGRSFQERRQTTLASLHAVGLASATTRSYMLERRAPLAPADRDYIQHTVFSRNWGDRLRELLTAEDWEARTRLCDEGSAGQRAAEPGLLLPLPDHGVLDARARLRAPRPRAAQRLRNGLGGGVPPGPEPPAPFSSISLPTTATLPASALRISTHAALSPGRGGLRGRRRAPEAAQQRRLGPQRGLDGLGPGAHRQAPALDHLRLGAAPRGVAAGGAVLGVDGLPQALTVRVRLAERVGGHGQPPISPSCRLVSTRLTADPRARRCERRAGPAAA